MATQRRHEHGGSARTSDRKRLAGTLVLVATYMVVEIVGGLLTNSLALLADAGHMFSDAGALGLALFALWFARRPASAQHTFGYFRAEILAALTNAATLVAVSIFIFSEAYRRLHEPPEVLGGPMMVIAAVGLLVNVASLWILRGGREGSLNVRAAWLHVLTDTLGSCQAVAAGGLIWVGGWNWIDPLTSISIGLLVVYSSWGLLRESVAVLMESAPGRIDVDDVRNAILAIPGVLGLCDLHVWTITSGLEALSAHVVVDEQRPHRTLLAEIRETIHEQFGIDHLTVQLEPPGFEEREHTV